MREPQTNIPDEHRCKNIQQNTSKSNPTIYQKDHPSRPSRVYHGDGDSLAYRDE